jgi:hypothetical protein
MSKKLDLYENDVKYAEKAFPGITKYECYDPYTDFVYDSYKCKQCPRKERCEKELDTILKVMDHYGTRKKKSTKPKTKRCKCK